MSAGLAVDVAPAREEGAKEVAGPNACDESGHVSSGRASQRRERNARFDFGHRPSAPAHKDVEVGDSAIDHAVRTGEALMKDVENDPVSPAESMEHAAAMLAHVALSRADYAKRSASVSREDETMERRRRQRALRARNRPVSPNLSSADAKRPASPVPHTR